MFIIAFHLLREYIELKTNVCNTCSNMNDPFCNVVKFMFSKKVTKIDKIFNVDLTVTTCCQIDGEDFVNFCGLLRKREL